MPIAVYDHTCGVVNTASGQKVVVAGGVTDSNEVGNTQIYDVQSGIWTDTGMVHVQVRMLSYQLP